MSKHLLTIGLILLAFLFLRKGCVKPEDVPAVPTESAAAAADGESYTLTLEAQGLPSPGELTVVLAADGSVVSARRGDVDLIRTTPATRRPFHLLLEYATGRTWSLPRDKWTSEPVDGGRRFLHEDGAFRVTKTVRLAPDGSGLDLDLEAEGLTGEMQGFVLTAVSGVPLGDGDEAPAAGFWEMEGDEPQIYLARQLVEARENEPRGRDAARRFKTPPQAVASRFGVLGEGHYVALENVPPTNALYLDVYRARRETGTTQEIEAYLSLIAPEGKTKGAYALRWTPREMLAERAPKLAAKLRVEPARTFTVENDRYRAVFTDRGGALTALWHKEHSVDPDAPPSPKTWVPIVREGARPGQPALTLHGNEEIYGENPAHETWEVTPDAGRGVTMTRRTARGHVLTKAVLLPAEGDALDVRITVARPQGSDAAAASLTLVGPSAAYVEDAYRDIIGLEPPHVVLLERSGGDNETETIDTIAEEPLVRGYSARRGCIFHGLGLRGAYVFTAFVLHRAEGDTSVAGPIRRAEGRAIELERDIERKPGETSRQSMLAKVAFETPLGADGSGTTRFRLFAGPTSVEAMRAEGLDEAIDFGIFGAIGRVLMWLMKLLQSLVGSYGVAIMLMTLVVRACLFPVSFKTQLGMQRYQKKITKIKPLLDEVQKKYANNPQKLNQEKLKVMREHKIGLPLGCLMMFIQLPIWFALFQALRVEFALRHKPFLWCDDLSMPDRLFAMPIFENVFLLPSYFNLFPILMLVLWVAQQRVTPMAQSDDPQVQMQM